MSAWQFIVLTVLLLIVAALLVVLLLRQARLETIHDTEDLQDDLVRIGEQVRESTRTSAEYNYQLRREVTGALQEGLKTQSEQLLAASKLETETLSRLQDRLLRILGDSLDRMQASNEERLTSMEQVVNEKLRKLIYSLPGPSNIAYIHRIDNVLFLHGGLSDRFVRMYAKSSH